MSPFPALLARWETLQDAAVAATNRQTLGLGVGLSAHRSPSQPRPSRQHRRGV